jgi:predicted ATP-grasp superfamily ATP-dependent carboligase
MSFESMSSASDRVWSDSSYKSDIYRLAVLEVNPRPSATLDLYDDRWRARLFDAHLKARGGELSRAPARNRALIA